jgi:hypothetical protein
MLQVVEQNIFSTSYLGLPLLDCLYFVGKCIFDRDLPLDDVAGLHLYPARVWV